MIHRETILKCICAGALTVAAVVGLGGIATGKPVWYHLENRGALGPLTRENIEYLDVEAPEAASPDGVISQQEWAAVYPEIAVTMGEMDQNTYQVDYLEESPYLVNSYEGYGFAKDYKSAIGHAYTLRDVAATERPHPMANCLTCKTPNFTKLVNDIGEDAYMMDFEEVASQMQETVSCYNCHGNNAGNGGELVVTHKYLSDALGDNISKVDPAVLSCGQCHMEYYFDPDGAMVIGGVVVSKGNSMPETGATVFMYSHDPKDSSSAMKDIVEDPDAVFGYSPDPESTRLKDFVDVIDWTDPVEVAKARNERQMYFYSMSELYTMIAVMQEENKTPEEIAKAVSKRRNELRLEAYKDDPEGLAEIKRNNLETYGHEDGPDADEVYMKYGSWQVVLEKALSTNVGMDICLGFYDEYFYTYGFTDSGAGK